MKIKNFHDFIFYNFKYYLIMKDIDKLIDEALGSLQYKNKNLNKLLSDIKNDIFNHNNNISYELEYNDIIQKYKIQWLNRLIIIVKNNVFSCNDAIALIEDSNSTIYNKEYIELATIIINNPLNHIILKSNIAHELNHYIKYYNVFLKNKKLNDTDLDFVINTPHKIINFISDYSLIIKTLKQFNKNNFNSYGLIKSVFLEILYFLNKSEINAHMENIYGEILKFKMSNNDKLFDISPTYQIYLNILNVLNIISNNTDIEFQDYLKIYIYPIFNKCFPNISFNKIIKRLINRNKTFIIKAEKLFNDLK